MRRAGRWRRGRWDVDAEVDVAALLPRVRVYFEECTLAVGVAVGDVADVDVQVELSAEVADCLVVFWPGRCARGERRGAVRRLARTGR